MSNSTFLLNISGNYHTFPLCISSYEFFYRHFHDALKKWKWVEIGVEMFDGNTWKCLKYNGNFHFHLTL